MRARQYNAIAASNALLAILDFQKKCLAKYHWYTAYLRPGFCYFGRLSAQHKKLRLYHGLGVGNLKLQSIKNHIWKSCYSVLFIISINYQSPRS